MRILIANDQHWPMRSGVATAVRTLAQGLADAGHTVMVVAPSQRRRGYKQVDENYEITRIRAFGLPFRKNFRVSVTYDREMRRILDDFQPDVVHVHTQFTVGIGMLRAAVNRNVPVVATNHVMPDNMIKNIKALAPISKPVSYFISEYGSLLYRGASRIVMPTESALRLFNLSRIEAPAVAISNGINLDKFYPSPAKADTYAKFSLPTDKTIISWIGRLDDEKHLHILIEVVRRLRDDGRDFHALLVGSGNSNERLRELVDEYNLGAIVTFTGLVSDEDLIELHRVGDVFVVPSPAELQCLAMLESMASGKPVVAVNAGALGELCIDGKTGFLLPVDDVDGIKHAVEQYLESADLRKKYGANAAKLAKAHDVRIVIPKFIKLYNEVIAEKN